MKIDEKMLEFLMKRVEEKHPKKAKEIKAAKVTKEKNSKK